MPSTTTDVGPLTLPLAAGTVGQRIADPAVDLLLDYLAFWLKDSLDARLANIRGTPSDACPVANRFAFDPLDPRGGVGQLPCPALYVWWDGKSVYERLSMVYDYRTRELQVLYVFPDLPQLAELERRAGLLAAVDATFCKAADRGRHPSYSYSGGAYGSMAAQQLASLDTFSFEYLGGMPGRFSADDQGSKQDKIDRSLPALRASFRVRERINQDGPADGDYSSDIELTLRNQEGWEDPIDVMTRYLPGPDGSEE